jgi:hypothetical protein
MFPPEPSKMRGGAQFMGYIADKISANRFEMAQLGDVLENHERATRQNFSKGIATPWIITVAHVVQAK